MLLWFQFRTPMSLRLRTLVWPSFWITTKMYLKQLEERYASNFKKSITMTNNVQFLMFALVNCYNTKWPLCLLILLTSHISTITYWDVGTELNSLKMNTMMMNWYQLNIALFAQIINCYISKGNRQTTDQNSNQPTLQCRQDMQI